MNAGRSRSAPTSDSSGADRRLVQAGGWPLSTALPLASALVVANGLQGTFLHWRGVLKKPGRRANLRYNVEMGPPAFAPPARRHGRRDGGPGCCRPRREGD